MPGFVNRVTLQGYLEIEQVVQVVLDDKSGLSAPVLHGQVVTDPALEMRHRLLIADRPAMAVLEVMRQCQYGREQQCMVSIGGSTVELLLLEGKPFVSIEGTLLEGDAGSLVNVSWISFLSTPEYGLLKQLQDRRLQELVFSWRTLSPEAKDGLYCLLRKHRTAAAFCDLTVTERA